jgi:hypothetical protein
MIELDLKEEVERVGRRVTSWAASRAGRVVLVRVERPPSVGDRRVRELLEQWLERSGHSEVEVVVETGQSGGLRVVTTELER